MLAVAVVLLVAVGTVVVTALDDGSSTTSASTAPPGTVEVTTVAPSAVTVAPTTTAVPVISTAATAPTTPAPPTTVPPTTVAPPATSDAPTTTGGPTTAPPPLPTFGNGTFTVGDDIQPGRYLSLPSEGCYFARLRDLSGTPAGIIAADNALGQAIVDIAATDAAFQSDRCAPWIAFIAASPVTTFGDGDWAVGTHLAPGRWQSTGGASCYWARTSDFSHTLTGIITNANVNGPAVVDIAATDVGFSSRRCGTWTRVG